MFKTFLLSLLFVTPTEITQSTVKIDCRIGDKIMVGSGTIIQTEAKYFYVLTCDHCVEPNVKIKIILQDSRSYPATVIKADKNRDMCLLKCDYTITIKASEIANDEKYLANTQIIISGFPKGGTYSQRSGVVSKYVSFSTKDKSIVHTILKGQVIPGDSGGGVFRHSDGKQIGILWGGSNGEVYINRVSTIRDFLKK